MGGHGGRAHAPRSGRPGPDGGRRRQGRDRPPCAGARRRTYDAGRRGARGGRRQPEGRRDRDRADRRDPGGQAHRQADPALPPAAPHPRGPAGHDRPGRGHGDARRRDRDDRPHGRRDGGDGRVLGRGADRLRNGQGHRAGRNDRAPRAAGEDRRQERLPPRDTMTSTPATRREQLMDGHGRPIGDVRISVTDRCNFRCQYCMPAEGLPWLAREELLTYEEITRLVALLASMGVSDVRLTGGEPLVRKELWRLIEMLSPLEDVHDISLTTNGYLLRRQVDDLVRAGLRPIKVNVVALRDFTEAEVVRFAEFAREQPYEVRFIEFMPLDADQAWDRDRVLPNEEIRKMIDAVYPLEPEGRERHSTARRWRFADGRGEIGFISPVSEPFCGDCNRIRITAEGMLRTCLFSMNETDLRAPLRSGASDDELEQIIRDAVWRKELKHHINDPGF